MYGIKMYRLFLKEGEKRHDTVRIGNMKNKWK
jgi:hypothetical protein